MAKVNKVHQKLLTLFHGYNEGDSISKTDILSHMETWSEKSLSTYVSKNKLDMFIKKTGDGNFVAIRNGAELTLEEVSREFTQNNPKKFTPIKGVTINGTRSSYTFESRMGAGAVGAVWKGVSSFMGQTEECAIKYLSPREDMLKESVLGNIRVRFKKEAEQGSKLDHKNVVKVLDHGQHEDVPFLIMELALESVDTEYKKSGVFELEKSLTIIDACLNGLEYLHSNTLVHRDIKPANILLMDRGYVIGDLGITKWSDFDEAVTSAGSLTKNSMQLGSWNYMAPEQRRTPKGATVPSDIFALGMSWYEMLTGGIIDPSAVGAKDIPDPTGNTQINDTIKQMLEYRSSDRPTIEDIRQKISSSGI